MSRVDVAALATGAIVGAVLTLGVLLVWTEASRPASFPTTITSLPTPFVIPSSTPRPELPLTLTPEGLGLVSFGDDGALVLRELETLLGPPSSDERWSCAEQAAEARLVGWADLGVFLFDDAFRGYLDAIHYPPEFGPVLGLKTPEGLGIGDPVDRLTALYGDRVALGELDQQFENEIREFMVDGDRGIWGIVENGPDGSRVITIVAGLSCFENAP